MLSKGVSGQGVYLYAYNTTTGLPKTGDASNITGSISLDGAASGATATAHPTEIGGGVYWQPLSQAEANANVLALYWSSTTTSVLIAPLVVLTDRSAVPNAAAGASGGLPTIGATIPNATAGAAGGLFIAGTNAATTVTASFTTTFTGNLTGNVGGSVQSISGVTFPTNFSSMSIDASGRMDLGKILGTASAGVAGYAGIDLTQALSDVATATVGGALNGAHASAWGKVVKDVAGKLLKVFSFGSTSVAKVTFDLDDGTTPTTRTPR